ncbi:uncharacterized protein LOC114256537 [Camellia sinensis]|uniref:uncharacterized protein LOC114256537 n=1 Tax=Camellia sinensis TaxID=4442 RepID=UPI00103684F3|nr:uncharacterized protein LOC114256537 [Camellia sinensis]
MEDDRDWGPKPFTFLNAWLLHPNFLSFWNVKVFGKVENKLKCIEEEAHALDLLAEDRPLLPTEILRRKEIRGDVWRLSKMLEWIWLQKSRVNWALKGDKNTRYFHIMACSRNSRNSLCFVVVNGTMLEDPMEIKAEVKAHFLKHFSEDWKVRPKFFGHFKTIGGPQVVEQLEAEFTEEEISSVIKTCNGNKALGPDGFNMAFFKKCWKIVKFDVLHFMREFHQNASLVGGIISSFIVLIPKNDSPSCLEEYRLISLIGSMYKILAKVLSNRMKQVMPKIISEVQSAFLGGRNIMDEILIANEIVDGWKRSNKKGLVLKLDFEKAYDSIN